MVYGEINGIKVLGMAAAVSNTWTPLTAFVQNEADEKVIKKFTKSTGVKGRYDAGENQTSSDFCYVAAKKLLESKGVSPQEIGAIVFVTQSPDYEEPATACVLQYRLGLSESCIAFDVNLGCSGFPYGLNIVSSLMKSNQISKALFVCGELASKMNMLDPHLETHASSMLFGDAGAAILLEKMADELMMYSSASGGTGFRDIIIPYGKYRHLEGKKGQKVRMDDLAVFEFSITKAPDMINEMMKKKRTTPDDYDCLVLHQANLMIIKQIAKKTGFPMEKTLISLDEFGNTSSASIPLTLVKHYGTDENRRTIRALMCGYGVGLSWSAVDMCIDTENILPIIHTDEYFEDGF